MSMRTRTRVLTCTLLAFGALGARPAPAASGWQAGVASISITPSEPVWLAGYGDRKHPSTGVLQEIHAKALALRDASGATVVLVTTDLLGFNRTMADAVAARVERAHGIPRGSLALTASHTHTGPVTGEVLRCAYDVDASQQAVITRYTTWLLDRVVAVVGSALGAMKPAELSFAQGEAGFAVNRRHARDRKLQGPVDHDVPVLAVRDPAGALRAVVFGYACHNTTLAGYEVSGDYAGFAQARLEAGHPGAVALFVAGCGADANPLPRRTVELARRYGDTLAAAVDLVLAGKAPPVPGPLRTAFGRVDLPLRPASREEFTRRLAATQGSEKRHAELMLAILAREGRLPDHYAYPVQVWSFGPGLTMLLLGGEVVADYALRFKARYGPESLWAASYANEVPFYVPSLRVLREGGYEGAGAMIGYGQPGPFGSAVEELIAEKVEDLMREAQAAP